MVGPAAPVARLIASGGLRVHFAVPPAQAGKLTLGQSVLAEVAGAANTLAGAIRYIAPELDPASKMVFVEAAFNRAAADLSGICPGSAVVGADRKLTTTIHSNIYQQPGGNAVESGIQSSSNPGFRFA